MGVNGVYRLLEWFRWLAFLPPMLAWQCPAAWEKK
jgi:hypothetical protein